jgi:hypothetical protein
MSRRQEGQEVGLKELHALLSVTLVEMYMFIISPRILDHRFVRGIP